MDCPFCQIIQESVNYLIYEDDAFIVIPDRDSLGFGHCMIIPKRHVTKVYELDEVTHAALFTLAKKFATKLEAVTSKKAVAYTAFGSGLPHAHLHLIPHDDIDVLVNPSKYTTRRTPEELRDMAQQLKEDMGI
jgi:histidine triad (HIT) family protein